MPAAKITTFHYIKGIDGLRAIAVLAVMLFHIDPLFLPGGFSGVDIFFVISGYVVSSSLARETNPHFFRFTLAFYARRIIRIFPALIACILLVSIITTLFVPASWLSSSTEKTGLYAFFGISNYALIWFNDGYFAPRVEFNSFTHTWSLAVEEQFYVLFPLIFFIWLKYKERPGGLGLLSNWLLAGLCIISLSYSWYETSNSPDRAFYLLPSRFWELACGALLFKLHSRHKFIPYSRFLAQWYLAVGILLVGSGFIFSNEKAFPFPWAMLSVSGAFLLICGVINKTEAKPLIQKVLENAVMVYTGKISYSLYLWHWPVYVLFRWTVGLETIVEIICAIAITVILANVSYHYIETPVRKNPFIVNKPNWQIISLGILVIVISFTLSQSIFKSQANISLSVTKDQQTWYPYAWPEKMRQKNLQIFSGRNLFILGNSHAGAYSTMLQQLTDEYGVKVHSYSFGCAYANLLRPESMSCMKKLDKLMPEIESLSSPGDIIFFASLRMNRIGHQYKIISEKSVISYQKSKDAIRQQKLALQEAKELFNRFEKLSMNVMIDAPKPVFRSPAFRCSDWFNKSNPICLPGLTIKRDILLEYRKPVMESLTELAHEFPQLIVWDPFPVLCQHDVCSAFDEGLPLFFDGDHLSAHGNRILYPSFLAKIINIWQPDYKYIN